MDSEIVYLIINDWLPEEHEVRFLEDIKTNKDNLGIVVDVVECSIDYYITASREWLEKEYPELLPYVCQKTEDHLLEPHGYRVFA